MKLSFIHAPIQTTLNLHSIRNPHLTPVKFKIKYEEEEDDEEGEEEKEEENGENEADAETILDEKERNSCSVRIYPLDATRIDCMYK